MKILVLTPQLPYPPRQGTTIRNYHLLRHLAAAHTVDLLSFLAPGERLGQDSPLHALCRRIATAPQPRRSSRRRAIDTLASPLPDMGLRLESAEMHDLARAWLAEGYDLIQVEGIEVAQYAMQHRGRAAIVFDDHNCEYLLQQRNAFTDLRRPARWPAAAYSLVQWRKLRAYEAAILRASDAVVAVSEADAAALRSLAPGVDIAVVPNGIDLDAYRPAPDPGPAGGSLVFTGKMDYRPNIDAALWFGQEVLPLITARAPQARFQIVGMNPHPRLDALRANPAIEITGAVDDTRPYIEQGAIYVIPMRVGGGTRFKALEAMALARPIVSTALGVEGFPVAGGRELLLGDSSEAFAAAVLRLLDGSAAGLELRGRLGRAARAFVENAYGWDAITPRLAAVHSVALDRRAAAPA